MKSMKKSMAITTILMVVLLIVALSTATFAWYTQQTGVSVTDTLVTSAKSDSTSIAIDHGSIADLDSTNTSIDITMNVTEKTGLPMIPTDLTKGTTNYATFITEFLSGTQDSAGKFIADPLDKSNAIAPMTIDSTTKNGTEDSTNKYFYVINTNRAKKTDLYMSVTINAVGFTPKKFTPAEISAASTSGKNLLETTENLYSAPVPAARIDNNPTYLAVNTQADPSVTYYVMNKPDLYKALRVAIFVNKPGETPTLLDIWAVSGQKATVGNFNAGDEVEPSLATNSLSLVDCVASGAKIEVCKSNMSGETETGNPLNGGTAREIRIVAWFDGSKMKNTDAAGIVSFSIAFSTTNT